MFASQNLSPEVRLAMLENLVNAMGQKLDQLIAMQNMARIGYGQVPYQQPRFRPGFHGQNPPDTGFEWGAPFQTPESQPDFAGAGKFRPGFGFPNCEPGGVKEAFSLDTGSLIDNCIVTIYTVPGMHQAEIMVRRPDGMAFPYDLIKDQVQIVVEGKNIIPKPSQVLSMYVPRHMIHYFYSVTVATKLVKLGEVDNRVDAFAAFVPTEPSQSSL